MTKKISQFVVSFFKMLKFLSKLKLKYFILSLLAALVVRKIIIGKIAMDYVKKHKNQIDFETMVIFFLGGGGGNIRDCQLADYFQSNNFQLANFSFNF